MSILPDAKLGIDARKPIFGVSDQASLNTACSATETSQNIEYLHESSSIIILSTKRTTKALIRLRGCTGLSAHLLFVRNKVRVSPDGV